MHDAAEPAISTSANTIQLFYNALHDRNIPVDFARPTEDLSKYKLVIAPSLQLLAGGEADLLKLYVQNGGTLVSTFNTGLVDEHHIAPDSGYPHDLTDLFGMEVLEFDPLPPGEENHLTFKGAFPDEPPASRETCGATSSSPKECQVLATYAKDFYAGRPALTMNTFGLGKAIYIGTHEPPAFLLRPDRVAAPVVQPLSAAQSAGHGRGQLAPERRAPGFISCSTTRIRRSASSSTNRCTISDRQHVHREPRLAAAWRAFRVDEQREHSHAPPANEKSAAPIRPAARPPRLSPRDRVLVVARGGM